MAKIEKFEDLDCWKAARELTNLVYEVSEKGKLRTDFDTKSQFKRAALSSMNNIAEGFTRVSQKEFMRFLDIARSSAGEVKSMTYILDDQNYIPKEDIETLHKTVDKTIKLTLGLLRYLRNKNK